MELLSNAPIPEGLLASMTLLNEKPRLGVRGRKSAPHQRIDERNCTAVLGLRFPCSEIVSGTVVAPNNVTAWYQNSCITSALGKGALSTALDAIGIIPEGGTISAAFSLFHGAAGISNGTKILGRVAFGAGLISTIGAAHDLQGSQQSALSTTVTGLQATASGFGIAKGLIEDIPVAGQAIAVGATALDVVGTGLEVAKCYQ